MEIGKQCHFFFLREYGFPIAKARSDIDLGLQWLLLILLTGCCQPVAEHSRVTRTLLSLRDRGFLCQVTLTQGLLEGLLASPTELSVELHCVNHTHLLFYSSLLLNPGVRPATRSDAFQVPHFPFFSHTHFS